MNFPTQFIKGIKRYYGEQGEQWMESLPELLTQCASKWNLKIGEMGSNLSLNYITDVQLSNGEQAILKLFPHKAPFMEMEALEHLQDHPGIINLILSDHDLAAMVIEKVSPGTSLQEVQAKDDEEAIRIAAPIIRDVQADVPAEHHLRTVHEEMQVIRKVRDAGIGDAETNVMLDKALVIFDELESSKQSDKLIHGDLHHDNILLDDERGWLAIDPKGRIGDPAYNAARIMRNYWDTKPTEPIVRKRIEILSDVMGHDQRRITAWAYLDCVLSECWDLDEIGKRGEDEKPLIALIETVLESYS